MNTRNKYTSIILLLTLILNSVICSPVYANNSEKNNEIYDGENTESTVENILSMGNDVASPSGIINDFLDNLFHDKISDDVISGSAIDYEIDEERLPDYVLSLFDDKYKSLDDDEKFQLNTYLFVREDTMNICCDNNFSVEESIPYALLMQILDIDLNTAINMVVNYASQKKALESANEYSTQLYDYACFADDNIRKLFAEYIINGYLMSELINVYTISELLNEDISDIILDKKTLSNGSDIGEDVQKFSKEYCVNIDTAKKIIDDYNYEEFKEEFNSYLKILERGNKNKARLGSDNQIEVYFDSSFKKGALSYIDGLGASIDPNTGTVLYTENICNIPGVAGLDLNLNLYYTSLCPIGPKNVDNRFNYAHNWRMSVPYMVRKDGEPLYGKSPKLLTLNNGNTYEMVFVSDHYRPSSCYDDELKLYNDFAHQFSTESFYKLCYKNGNIDYFNDAGNWIGTEDKFGNKIVVTKNSDGSTQITDTNNNIIKIKFDDTVQTITKPDGNKVIIDYSKNTYGSRIKNVLNSITYPGGITTEFTYDCSSNDNYQNILLRKIKTPSGLEKHFSYSWTDKLKYSWEPKTADINYEFDKYDYARISEEYLLSDGKVCDKKTYSYDSNFMIAESNYSVFCPCSSYDECICQPYFIGDAWACNKFCENCSTQYSCPYVHNRVGDNLNYSTTVNSVNGTSVKYTFNALKQNILTEEYSGTTLLNKTEKTFYTDKDYCDLPTVVKYTEGGAERIEKYTYTNLFDVRTYNVFTNNKELSSVTYNYDYDSNSSKYYGIPTKITAKMSDNTNIVQTNTLLNNSTSMSGKVIAKSVMVRGSDKESATTYTYDTKGRNTVKYDYIDSGETKNIKTTLTYSDSTGFSAKPTEVKIDGWNGSTKYVYDKLGRVLSVTKPNNTKDNCAYDGIGNITKVGYCDDTGSEKSSVSLQYNYANNTITYTNENGKKEVYDYDPVGNPVSVTKNGSIISSYTYDTRLRPVTYTEGKSVTTYTYDNRDRLTSEIVKEGTKVLSNKSYTYENNSIGLKTTETIKGDSVSADITNIVQNDIMDRSVMENKAGDITNYTYDMLGNVIKEQEYRGTSNNTDVYLTKDYTYDHAGNVLSVKETDGNNVINKYNTYDMLGRMVTSTDAKGNTTTYKYNTLGQVTEKKIPFAADSSGNMVYTYNKYTYDSVGNVISESVTDGVTNNYTYDYRNRVTKAVSGAQSVEYVYDNVGNIVEYKTANGTQVHKYDYDGLNRVVKYTDALGKSETYTYDSNNDMTSKKDRNGKTITYTYDGLHRMLTEKATGVNNSWTYCMTGAVKSEKNDNASKTYTYNNKGLVFAENTTIGSDTFTIKRYYDSRGNNLYDYYSKNNQNYRIMRYWHDNKNRMKTVDESTDNGTTYNRYVEYFYDVNNNLTSAHYGNNTYQVYYYNAANLITCMDMVRKSDNKKLEHIVQNYRFDGNISSKSETYGGSTINTAYTYDSTGRLTKEAVTGEEDNFNLSYTYDNAGNRTSVSGADNVTYSYDANNRLVSETSKYDIINYTYDNNGNQIKKEISRINSDGTVNDYTVQDYTYNGLNQLTHYEVSNGVDPSCNYSDYKYMANGYRLSMSVKDVGPFGEDIFRETKYLWDKDNVVSFMDSSNNITDRFCRGYQLICDGNGKYYMHDPHGNVIETYNTNQTTPFERYHYNAFGTQNGFNDTDLVEHDNEWGYCGQMYNNYTRDYYMRARNYNPAIGRFITEDPIKYGSNWYSYCGGNPVIFIDPNGLAEIIMWSYGSDDIKEYAEHYNKSNEKQLSVDGNMEGWDEATKYDFYLTNAFYRAALTKKAELMQNGISEDEIQVIRIDNVQNLNDVWNNLSSGRIVVDNLYFYSHGTPSGPEVRNGSGNFWESASKLNWNTSYSEGTNQQLVQPSSAYFYGCHTGEGTFAQNFASKQDVMVFAQIGGASFSISRTYHIPIKPIDKGLGVYLETFESSRGLKNNDGEGKLFFPGWR